MQCFSFLAARPFFTNDAITLGILIILLALIFHTSSLENKGWQRFYRIVPALLLCYFLPALLHWPLNLIGSHWYTGELDALLQKYAIEIPWGASFDRISSILQENGVPSAEYTSIQGHSNLYYIASRFLLPASLILLCLSIDLKGVLNLGPKALIMFGTATVGIIIGGPIALLVSKYVAPGILGDDPDMIWRGLSTVAGSWIGGGANQTAMKEIFEVDDNLFGTMIIVDVVVANIWMGFLLYGANIRHKIDNWLQGDVTAIDDLQERVANYRKSVESKPTTTKLFVLMAVAFGGVAISHWGADVITPIMKGKMETLNKLGLNSLASHFFWLIVISTSIGIALSFSRFRKLEGVGASTWGSIFIYFLVATIGMKMNLGEVVNNLGLFFIGITWMLVHVTLLLVMAKLIKAPFFFVAVGSQANIGGAASAPIVASAFNPTLAPVGVLMAVLGYAIGTIGALVCAGLMQSIAT